MIISPLINNRHLDNYCLILSDYITIVVHPYRGKCRERTSRSRATFESSRVPPRASAVQSRLSLPSNGPAFRSH